MRNRDDEDMTERFLMALGLKPERFPGKDSRREGKTPDFKVSAPTGEFFYCEQKNVMTKTGQSGIHHGTKHNSMTENIHNAAKKFRAVNAHRLSRLEIS